VFLRPLKKFVTAASALVMVSAIAWIMLGDDSAQVPPNAEIVARLDSAGFDRTQQESSGRPQSQVARDPSSAALSKPFEQREDRKIKRTRPHSLQGTHIDGGLFVDTDGHFKPTSDALEMFDYFFSALGEETYDDVVARITSTIGRRLGPPASGEALAFLSRYLDYRTRAGNQGNADSNLLERFENLKELRREVFGEELANSLFATDEAFTRTRLEQSSIENDPALSVEQKRERINALTDDLYDSLPKAVLEARERALAPIRLREDEASMIEHGASDDQIQAVREKRFGSEAAERLKSLDAKRVQWNDRVRDFQSHRQDILNDSSLSDTQQRAAVDDLLKSSFSSPERTRVAALDRIAGQGR